jgi:hypothetical protein
VPHRLSDADAKPWLQHYAKADAARASGKSYVWGAQDQHNRSVTVFGVAENTFHDRGLTPAVRKSSPYEDNSHGFPQSMVSNPAETDRVNRMVAENHIGNQGTTRAIENNMGRQPASLLNSGHIAKVREVSYSPTNQTTQSPALIRDTTLRRSNSLNHIDVLHSMQHDNGDIPRLP